MRASCGDPGSLSTLPLKEQSMLAQVPFECSPMGRNIFATSSVRLLLEFPYTRAEVESSEHARFTRRHRCEVLKISNLQNRGKPIKILPMIIMLHISLLASINYRL